MDTRRQKRLLSLALLALLLLAILIYRYGEGRARLPFRGPFQAVPLEAFREGDAEDTHETVSTPSVPWDKHPYMEALAHNEPREDKKEGELRRTSDRRERLRSELRGVSRRDPDVKDPSIDPGHDAKSSEPRTRPQDEERMTNRHPASVRAHRQEREKKPDGAGVPEHDGTKQTDLASLDRSRSEEKGTSQPDETPQPAVVALGTSPLDPDTRTFYRDLRAAYPDYRGWVELPAWGISEPFFMNEDEPNKYYRQDYRGRYSVKGEYFLRGTPGTSRQIMILGHSLLTGEGMAPIDALPDQDVDALSETSRQLFLDDPVREERRRYRLVAARYFPKAETKWAYTDFATPEDWTTYVRTYTGLEEAPDHMVTLVTCHRSRAAIRTVLYYVPWSPTNGRTA